MSRNRVLSAVAIGAFSLGAVALETVAGRRLSHRLARAVSRTARYQSGLLAGFRYRLAGHQPDPGVDSRVLADRIRSTLGPVEHRLDIPHVHVMADGHHVLLHGDVVSHAQGEELVEVVRRIAGVHQVESHLHVGLVPGDTGPSESAGHRTH